MTKIKNLIKLIRIKNWIKNGLILIPLFFSGEFIKYDLQDFIRIAIGLFAFCLASSIVYIINDLMDAENDKHDENKKHRPIASGAVKPQEAIILAVILYIAISIISFRNITILCTIFLNTYIILNVLYSVKLKNIPIIDISVLSCFFLIRLIYGGCLYNVPISGYLYLTTTAIAYYFGIGKRYKESTKNNLSIRTVLKHYPQNFLTNIHNVFLCASILSYFLWAINYNQNIINPACILISAFIVTIILLCYHFILYDENNKNGNPVDMLLNNKLLLAICVLYIIIMIIGFYI